MVDGRVGLHAVDDGVGVGAVAGQRDRPVQRADDALGDGAAQAQRGARGDHFVADLELVGVTERGPR